MDAAKQNNNVDIDGDVTIIKAIMYGELSVGLHKRTFTDLFLITALRSGCYFLHSV